MKKTLEHALLGVDDVARNTRTCFTFFGKFMEGTGKAYDAIDEIIDLIEEIKDEEMSDRLTAALAEALDFGEEAKKAMADYDRAAEKIRNAVSSARKA
jgi:hypothetical protein